MTLESFVLGFYNFYPLGIVIAAAALFIGQNGYDEQWHEWLGEATLEHAEWE